MYVLGGFNSGIGFNSPLGEVEVYDPLTNTWGGEVGAGVLNMNLSRGDLAAGTLKGWVFAVGGGESTNIGLLSFHVLYTITRFPIYYNIETKENNISVPVQIVERYVPDEGVWYDEEGGSMKETKTFFFLTILHNLFPILTLVKFAFIKKFLTIYFALLAHPMGTLSTCSAARASSMRLRGLIL